MANCQEGHTSQQSPESGGRYPQGCRSTGTASARNAGRAGVGPCPRGTDSGGLLDSRRAAGDNHACSATMRIWRRARSASPTKNDPLPPWTDSDSDGVHDILRSRINRRATADAGVLGEQAPSHRAQHPSGVHYVPELSIVSRHRLSALAYLDMKSLGHGSGSTRPRSARRPPAWSIQRGDAGIADILPATPSMPPPASSRGSRSLASARTQPCLHPRPKQPPRRDDLDGM